MIVGIAIAVMFIAIVWLSQELLIRGLSMDRRQVVVISLCLIVICIAFLTTIFSI